MSNEVAWITFQISVLKRMKTLRARQEIMRLKSAFDIADTDVNPHECEVFHLYPNEASKLEDRMKRQFS